MRVYMQFTVSLELYIDIGTRYIPDKNLFSISLESEQKQGREYMQFMAEEVFIYLCLFIFDYRALVVCVKDRT